MPKTINLSERQWDIILQSIYHRRLQTESLVLKADLRDIEVRIDAQLREQTK